MTFPTYPKYKDSGEKWIGKIPDHWSVIPIKHRFRVIGGSTPKSDVAEYWGGDINWITPADLSKQSKFELYQSERKITVDGLNSCGTTLIPEGSVVMSTRAPIGKVGIAGVRLCTNQGCKSLVAKENQNSKFLAYVLNVATEELNIRGRGTTFLEISGDELGSFKYPVPRNFDESVKIVEFLDHELEKIDALISEQEKLIITLREKINALVLNSIERKNSRKLRLIHAVELIKRPVNQVEGELYEPLGLYNRGRGLFHKERREMADMGDSDFFWIKSGDLIFSGQFAWEGAVSMAYDTEEDCVVSHRYPVIRGKKDIVMTEYLYALFTTTHGDFLLNECSIGAAGRNRPLNINLLMKEEIFIPNQKIQKEISVMVNQEKHLRNAIEWQRKLLVERRNALISCAVTGQIDVRKYVCC